MGRDGGPAGAPIIAGSWTLLAVGPSSDARRNSSASPGPTRVRSAASRGRSSSPARQGSARRAWSTHSRTSLAGSGVRVLIGGCLPLGTGGLPYGPFVEAFRALFRDVDPGALSALLGPSRGELARLMPEVRGRPDRHEPGPRTRCSHGGWFVARRTFRAGPPVRARSRGPRTTVADRPRRRRGGGRPVGRPLHPGPAGVSRAQPPGGAGAPRRDDAHATRPIPTGDSSRFLAELERGERVDRIDLARFDRDELARLLADELGHVPDAGTVDRILERTDGNPFYAEQVVAASRETGSEAVPARLRDVVLARVSAVSDAGQELLRVASAAGARIDDGLLESVCDLPAPTVRAALREVVDRRILVPCWRRRRPPRGVPTLPAP